MNDQMKHGNYFKCLFGGLFFLLWFTVLPAQVKDTVPGERIKIIVSSSIDATPQPSYLYLPPKIPHGKKIPLVVFLHTWSGDLEQRYKSLETEAAKRGWLLLAPNFRGRNDHPEACGSRFAQQDILDAVGWVKKHYSIDKHRVYLAGFSGGGYLAMMMTFLYPKYWAAASAWCAISDLTIWYDLHKNDQYGKMMRQVFGGSPSGNDSITKEYHDRSPIYYISKRNRVPLDIAAGGYDSVVPPRNSINVYNALALTHGYAAINEAEIDHAMNPQSLHDQGEFLPDPVLKRRIFFRKQEGRYRFTLFEGAHEWIPEAAIQWLAGHRKK